MLWVGHPSSTGSQRPYVALGTPRDGVPTDLRAACQGTDFLDRLGKKFSWKQVVLCVPLKYLQMGNVEAKQGAKLLCSHTHTINCFLQSLERCHCLKIGGLEVGVGWPWATYLCWAIGCAGLLDWAPSVSVLWGVTVVADKIMAFLRQSSDFQLVL